MSLLLKAKEMLKIHSKEYVIDKLSKNKTGRLTATYIKNIVEEASKL